METRSDGDGPIPEVQKIYAAGSFLSSIKAAMSSTVPNPSLRPREVFAAWGRILTGSVPMLSIEITRECPLSCPGCYAYGDSHLGGGVTLSELNDLRGDKLVDGVLELVRKHKPLHVSLVGGEPMVRHRELSRILPDLSKWNCLRWW